MLSLRRMKLFFVIASMSVVAFIVLFHALSAPWSQDCQKQATALQRETNSTQVSQEAHHLFFLKVHKAASTTVLNVIYRFALTRHLLVLLPRKGNVFSEYSKKWRPKTLPLPPGAGHFDVLCNHLVFEEKSVRRSLHKDAFFVGIVREPFDQFLSAFKYYRDEHKKVYLNRIQGKWPAYVHSYLENPWFWEIGHRRSYTNNRMSVDFGMKPRALHDAVYVKSYISYLNSTFHLVMVSNRFDESLILLRRLLGWKIQDVIYIRNNVFGSKRKIQNFTDLERQAHRKFNLADYELYEHFSRVLDDKIRAAGDNFQAEVKAFSVVLNSVQEYCLAPRGPDGAVKIVAEFWGEEFLLTSQMCDLMMLEERSFVERMREANEEVIIKQSSSHPPPPPPPPPPINPSISKVYRNLPQHSHRRNSNPPDTKPQKPEKPGALTEAEIVSRFQQRRDILQSACSRYSSQHEFRKYRMPLKSFLLYKPAEDLYASYCPSSLLTTGEKLDSFAFRQQDVLFGFVRDPYSRLVSAYVDKLFCPSPLFWRSRGQYIVQTFRQNADPWCDYPYKYIGHLETLREDMPFILKAIHTPVPYTKSYDSDTIADFADTMLRCVRAEVTECMELDESQPKRSQTGCNS
ncbi:uncharacterized protein LOC143276391 [Babylonia areolata]|uniref:uncharacterized protein LOC143276391 n=1 Tax=Babylonia areolata TaxID=304850 RepID=UPI003FCFE584